jgi:CRP/FNR family cyclic AMP-dependent transcriptional regulator
VEWLANFWAEALRFIHVYATLVLILEVAVSNASVVNSLKQSDIFYQFTPTQLELVANICHEANYQKDDLIFKENSSSKELYIIIQGEVDIIVDPSLVSISEDGIDNKVIATMRRGQSFGEVALVDEGLRSASACAAQKDTRLLIIPRDKLVMLCETYPQLGYRLMYNLAADLAMKIRNTDLRIREQLLYRSHEKK